MDPTVAQAIAIIKELGFPMAVTGYLLYRDWKFLNALTATIARWDALLEKLVTGAPPDRKVG